MTDDSYTRNARHHLNELIEQLLAAHARFMQAIPDERAGAFAERWVVLIELEEFLKDACVELTPEDGVTQEHLARLAQLNA